MTKFKELKREGSLILEQVDFKNLYYCQVKAANKTGARIYLPKKLEGKYVYVIVDPKQEKG